jgi:glycosyltransferase involved in cell wall biosynthesis
MYHTISLPEYIGQLVRKVPALANKGYQSYIKDNLFDALARRYIPACDIFHAWGNYALISMPNARAYGAKIVIERGSTHPYYQDAILREECERYGIEIERAHKQIIEKGLEEIEEADRAFIPSEFVRRSFIENGVPGSKLRLIPYGIDLENFSPAPKRDSVFRVLFVGNIGIQKGVHYLLEAWKRLALPNAELVLLGAVDPGMKNVLARYEGLFVLAGHVKHELLPMWYTNASVFVLPSLQEGSALVTYEAMACGVPLIVSTNTGSVVRDGVDGYVVPIRDVESLQSRIQWMYEHHGESLAMGTAANEYVQNYSWSHYGDRVMAEYDDLLSEPGAF